MKFGKTVLTLCLAAVLAVAVLPFSRPAAAASAEALKIENGTLVSCDPSAAGELVIPEGVTKIGSAAFSGCTMLESVVLPASLKEIGSSAFAGCTSLTAFEVHEENTHFSAVDGVLYSISGAYLMFYPLGRPETVFTVPDGVEVVQDSAAEGALYLETLIAPASLKMIGRKAFRSCGALKKVVLEGVQTIEQMAFAQCASLAEVTLPQYTLKTIEIRAFANCSQLSEFYLPKGLNEVGAQAFDNCVGLKKVTVGGAASIKSDAFRGCTGVTSLVLEEGCTRVGDWEDAEALRTVTLPSTLESLPLWLFKAMCGDSLQTVSFANTPARWDDLVQAEWEKHKISPNARHYIETYPKEKVHFIAPPTTVTTTTVTTTVSTTVSTTATGTLPTEATSTQPTATQTTATDRTTDTVVPTLPGVATTTVAVLPEADRPTGSSTVYWIIGGVAALVLAAVAASVLALVKRR